MALFKISKGLKANLPLDKVDGYCWFTIDDGLFYIDYEDENGELQRKALNAKDAETLSGASLATILNSNSLEIPTSKAVFDALAEKADAEHTHNSVIETNKNLEQKFWRGTQAEYDAIETKDPSTMYIITDGDEPVSLPEITENDEGKLLRIVDGTPAWTSLPDAEWGEF